MSRLNPPIASECGTVAIALSVREGSLNTGLKKSNSKIDFRGRIMKETVEIDLMIEQASLSFREVYCASRRMDDRFHDAETKLARRGCKVSQRV